MRQAKCINVCVDEKKGKVTFRDFGLDSGILFAEDMENNNPLDNQRNKRLITVESDTLENIFL